MFGIAHLTAHERQKCHRGFHRNGFKEIPNSWPEIVFIYIKYSSINKFSFPYSISQLRHSNNINEVEIWRLFTARLFIDIADTM